MAAIQLTRTIVTLENDQIAKFTKDVETRTQLAVYKLGRETRDMARRLAPKKTGALRASIYVTRPGTQNQNPESGPSYARQSTIGYFRAINAAYRRQLSPTGRSIRKLNLLNAGDYEPGHADERTQTLSPSAKKAVGISETQVKINGVTYNAQNTSENVDAVIGNTAVPFQSVMPYAGVDRNSFFVAIGAAVFYAGYVEFGVPSRGIAPQPFLSPSIKWAREQVVSRMAEAINGGAT